MRWRLGIGLLAVTLSACTATPTRSARSGAGAPGATTPASDQPGSSVTELAAAIQAAADRSDREPDAKVRSQLAEQASSDADRCLALAAEAVACTYGSAVALGLEARAHPTRAIDLLKKMLDALGRAEAAGPDYDEAGPARVQALVLVRAPGWPLGPGDPDSGLAAARRAVALRPQYPPNLLALAEAQAKTGDLTGARDSYSRAREAALAMPTTADRDAWLRQADDALKRSAR